MTPSATRVLVLAAAGALTLGATLSHACERSKSAVASACSPSKSTAVVAAAPAKSAADKSCAAPSAVTAKKASAKKSAPVTAAKKGAPAVAGMRVQIDPETGALVPATKALAADGLPVLDEMPSDLPQVALPGGGYMVDLQGYMQEYATVRLDAKGNKIFGCSPRPRAALKAPVAPTAVDRSEK